MIYLRVENLNKSYGDKMLLTDVSFTINQGDKIGIVARNGSGKTTLLNIIAGTTDYDSGSLTFHRDLKVAYLEQTPRFNPTDTVIEACLQRGTPQADAIIDYEAQLATGDPEAIHRASALMDAATAWDYEERITGLLSQLEITDLNATMGTLSGGQTKRVALARAIISDPQLLILDEPTNHLDIPVIEWLEDYLKRSRLALLLVTHDRYFLDRVCNRIIEIDRTSIFCYDGNYDYFLRRRAERIEALTAELAKNRNLLRRETEWMRRQPQARATKAKYRIDQYYDLRESTRVNLTDRNVELNVGSSRVGSKIFQAHDVSKRYDGKVILDHFNYTFARYEKLGIVGRNGVGKSTFIKMLQGLVEPDSGHWEVGQTIRFGYYSQEGINLDPGKRVIDAVTDLTEDIVVNQGVHYSPMQFLQKFLFTVPDQQKYISTLSGGERARLHLATVLMRSPNFLILDEPTNDLDIVTLGILEEYLRDFGGCLIVVSHDRFFLDSIVDHIFVMEGDGVVKDFPGNYTEWREARRAERSAERKEEQEAATAATPRPQRHAERKPRLSFKERRELEELTERIATLEQEIAALDALFSSGEVVDDITEQSARYSRLKEELDEAELRWLELSEIEG